jgi:hypothetical protein
MNVNKNNCDICMDMLVHVQNSVRYYDSLMDFVKNEVGDPHVPTKIRVVVVVVVVVERSHR